MVRIVLAVLAILAMSESAGALPRYSALYGQDCGLCHHDPTGGGLRSLYASQYLVPTELAARSPELESIDPLLAERVIVGTDLRTLFRESEDGSSVQLQMQADLRFALLVDDRTSIRVDVGRDGVSEAFGLAYLLPAHGWLRAGLFTPNYGWKFADHQLFARQFVPSRSGVRDPAAWDSAGMEIGLSPGPVVLTASLDDGAGVGESWTGSGTWRANRGEFGVALGASAMRREHEFDHRRSAGVHGLVRIGPVVWLGQWDEPREAGRRERILTQELTIVVARGWTLRATHGFQDPDRDLESGIRQQFGAGLDLLATPFFGVLAMANYRDADQGADVSAEDGWAADFVFHFLY